MDAPRYLDSYDTWFVRCSCNTVFVCDPPFEPRDHHNGNGSIIGPGFTPNTPLARGCGTRMSGHVCLPSDGHCLLGGLLCRCPKEIRGAVGRAADAKQGLLEGVPCDPALAPKD